MKALDISSIPDKDICYRAYTNSKLSPAYYSRQSFIDAARLLDLTVEKCSAIAGITFPATCYPGVCLPNDSLWCYRAYTDITSEHESNRFMVIRDAVAEGFTKETCEQRLKVALPATCSKETFKCYPKQNASTEVQPAPDVPRSNGGEKRLTSTGTGFFIGGDLLVTNKHVVDQCSAVKVRNITDEYIVNVVNVDQDNDLAVVKITGRHKFSKGVEFRSGRSVRLGDEVVTVGYPLGPLLGAGIKSTKGNVSGLSGLYGTTGIFQISAPVQPGNSGGPLLDQHGNLAGVIVAKLNAAKIQNITGDIPQNVNFAIKDTIIRNFLEANDIEYSLSDPTKLPLIHADIVDLAKQYTVKVECYK